MSPARKPIPRAVLEERLRVLEEARAKRRLFIVQFGVFIANAFGVLGNQLLSMSEDIKATVEPLEIGQVAGAMIIAMLVYAKTHTSKKDLTGMAKKGNVFRVLLTAFSNGFMWMTITGAWW